MAASRYATKFLAMALAAVVAVLVFAGTALADDAHKVVVQGADYHASGSALTSGEVDVATVAGAKGDMVFVSVNQEGVCLSSCCSGNCVSGSGEDEVFCLLKLKSEKSVTKKPFFSIE